MGNPNILSGYSKRRGNVTRRKTDLDELVKEALNISEPIDDTVAWNTYHLNMNKCLAHSTRNPVIRNCRLNPYCIERLGLEKFDKLRNMPVEETPKIIEKRDLINKPCGLINHASICYVNSFLQIWFNDLAFRQCIFNWREDPNFVKPEGVKMDIQAVMNCLQRLFFKMQVSPFETEDAEQFAHLLNLEMDQQKDAQEFMTLFFSSLERNLVAHSNGHELHEFLRIRFESIVHQTLICSACGLKSESESVYRSLELSIAGIKTLSEAIEKFLTLECLNDFKCDGCGSCGNVTKSLYFKYLAPVLWISLNRADKEMKKITAPIEYTRTMQERVFKPHSETNLTYNLVAVLIHQGTSTKCGHYYDVIKYPHNNLWYTFNDKEVIQSKFPGVEVEGQGASKRPATDLKGCYALVYQREDANQGLDWMKLKHSNSELAGTIEEDLSERFLRQSEDAFRSRKYWHKEVVKRHNRLLNFFQQMQVKNGLECQEDPNEIVFLPTDLLLEIFIQVYKSLEKICPLMEYNISANTTKTREELIESMQKLLTKSNEEDSQVYPIEPFKDTYMYLCAHSKVALDDIQHGEIKAVNRKGAENFLQYFKIVVRSESFEECAKNETVIDLTTNGSKVDLKTGTYDPTKFETDSKPVEVPNGDAVWVSERHFKQYRRLALDQVQRIQRENVGKEKLRFSFEPDTHETSHLRELTDKLSLIKSNISEHEIDTNEAEELSRKRHNEDIVSLDNDSPLKRLKTAEGGNIHMIYKENKSPINILSSPLIESLHESPISKNLLNLKLDKTNQQAEKSINEEKSDLIKEYTSYMDFKTPTHEISLKGSNKTQAEILNKITEGFKDKSETSGEDDLNISLEKSLDEDDLDEVQITGEKKSSIQLVKFNSDLYCPHDKLSMKNKRCWIGIEDWKILEKVLIDYFPPFPYLSQECEICLKQHIEEMDQKKVTQNNFDAINSEIGPLIKIIEKRKNSKGYTKFLCSKFVRDFQKASRAKSVSEIPKICQNCLICEHGNFFVCAQQDLSNLMAYPICNEEWDLLLSTYSKYHQIDTAESPSIPIVDEGDKEKFCEPCFKNNSMPTEFLYRHGAYIFIKQKEDENDDIEKIEKRVSTRRLTSKSCVKIMIQSDETILELKRKLYTKLNYSPVDQLLCYNGEVLLDNHTLEEYHVEAENAENPIILIVQQSFGSSNESTREIERGFRESNLD